MRLHYYEVLDREGRRVCMCGSEEDARMMMSLGDNRSWVKCSFLKPDTVFTTATTVEDTTKVLEPSVEVPFNPK